MGEMPSAELEQHDDSVRRPCRRARLAEAACDGTADGLRAHLPDCVGICGRGISRLIPASCLGAFLHFALDVGPEQAAAATALAAGGGAILERVRRDQTRGGV